MVVNDEPAQAENTRTRIERKQLASMRVDCISNPLSHAKRKRSIPARHGENLVRAIINSHYDQQEVNR